MQAPAHWNATAARAFIAADQQGISRMSRTAVWVALIAIVLVALYLLQANGMIRF